MKTQYILCHSGRSVLDGAPGPGSGARPLGSGERPYQRFEGSNAKLSRGPMLKEYHFSSGSNSNSSQNNTQNTKTNKFGKYLTQDIKGGKDKPKQSRAEIVTKGTRNIVSELENARANMQRSSDRKAKGLSAKGMSDTDLRNAINRIQMERTYESLTRPETKSGYIKAEEILSVVGTTVSIAAAAATIASTIYTIKNNK